MVPKGDPSGFRTTSVIRHPAERAISIISRSVLSLLLNDTCICYALSIVAREEEEATYHHVEPKCERVCFA